ncbi:hypothetical protein AT258_18765 [Bacillus wiedmannii]|uniref:hypothetical protein n=1 Tax=Bacillus TaxID=1386 RepID=UPI0001A00614|nr:hypothetical protein [Bacillus cereus]EEK75802.1 hypothetical protein bcere0009_53270 [Bacillus cereus R309803]KXY71942.1 hypothetical protein AT258_18765 [Bacillus wiedmannii]HDR4563376.1 hypothetical protein [Bacillus luti]MBL3852753.1 hypothetical protein [Bacillus cereus]HDR4564071.1 hypothetical protein [Bacillus luti]
MIEINKDTNILMRKPKDVDAIEFVFTYKNTDQKNVVSVPAEYSIRAIDRLLNSLIEGCKEMNETIFLKEEDLHLHLPMRRKELASFFIDYLKEKSQKLYGYALFLQNQQYWSVENIIIDDFTKKRIPNPKVNKGVVMFRFKIETKLTDCFHFLTTYTKIMGLRHPFIKAKQFMGTKNWFEYIMFDAARSQLKNKNVIKQLDEFIRTDKTLRLRLIF